MSAQRGTTGCAHTIIANAGESGVERSFPDLQTSSLAFFRLYARAVQNALTKTPNRPTHRSSVS